MPLSGDGYVPDARMKKVLTEALAVANAASRSLFMNPRDPSWFYYPSSAETFLEGGQHPPGEEGRLRDHWKERAGDQAPTLIKVDWIDRLNVEDVLRVLTSTHVKVC